MGKGHPEEEPINRPADKRDNRNKGRSCKHCGRDMHPRDRCPAKNAKRMKCKHKGHFAAYCFLKNTDELSLDMAFLGTLTSDRDSFWITPISTEGQLLTSNWTLEQRSLQSLCRLTRTVVNHPPNRDFE